MDAKILKAAVSAAIKVTITTTLVGCGGMVTSSGSGPGAEPLGGPAGSSGQGSAAKSSGDPVGAGYPKSEPASGGNAGAEATTAAAATGGAAIGGAPVGGMATAAEAGNAGAPNGGSAAATCVGEEVDACYTFLAQAQPQTKFGEPLPPAEQACCRTVLDSLVNGQLSYVCLSDNSAHFDQSARGVCCRDPASWSVYPACAPWGPPVPPELSPEALLDWQAAA